MSQENLFNLTSMTNSPYFENAQNLIAQVGSTASQLTDNERIEDLLKAQTYAQLAVAQELRTANIIEVNNFRVRAYAADVDVLDELSEVLNYRTGLAGS